MIEVWFQPVKVLRLVSTPRRQVEQVKFCFF